MQQTQHAANASAKRPTCTCMMIPMQFMCKCGIASEPLALSQTHVGNNTSSLRLLVRSWLAMALPTRTCSAISNDTTQQIRGSFCELVSCTNEAKRPARESAAGCCSAELAACFVSTEQPVCFDSRMCCCQSRDRRANFATW